MRKLPSDPFLRGMKNRVLQLAAQFGPGAGSVRVKLHRWRGVRLGKHVHIGAEVILETAYPQWISIGNNIQLGIRTMIVAHIHGLPPLESELRDFVSVRIEDDVYIGPGAIILPNVTIGKGAVIAAGSVVTHSVPPLTMIQGNPAKPVARCGVPLTWDTPLKEFYRHLRPLDHQAQHKI